MPLVSKVKIIAKENVCVGSGRCAMLLPEIFKQSEDDGIVELLSEEADANLLKKLKNVVDSCPSRALSLEYDRSLYAEACPHVAAHQDYTASIQDRQIHQFPIFDSKFKANPFKLYNQWLEQGKSIVYVELPTNVKTWLVVSHNLAKELLNDERLSKDSKYASDNWHKSHPTHKNGTSHPVFKHILTMDPPDHTRVRGMVSQEFTPKLIKQLRPRIEAIAKELLDNIDPYQPIDLIEEFALPLPLKVICELLGVPFEDEQFFKRWSEILVTANLKEQKLIPVVAQELNDYLLKLSVAKKKAPDESLFSKLVQLKEQGDLTEKELTAMGFLLLVAGHETTVNLIGNGTLALLSHPDQWFKLCDNPNLTRRAVEELLRFGSPIEVSTQRFAKTDINAAGTHIQKGDTVFIALASANRDASVFHDSNNLNINRADVSNHLAFGGGAHFCLGAPLARLEGEIAFGEFSRRFPHMKLAISPDDTEWRVGLIMRGLKTLPIILKP